MANDCAMIALFEGIQRALCRMFNGLRRPLADGHDLVDRFGGISTGPLESIIGQRRETTEQVDRFLELILLGMFNRLDHPLFMLLMA